MRFVLPALAATLLLDVAVPAQQTKDATEPTQIRLFHDEPISQFPRALLARDYCDGPRDRECLDAIRETGHLWSADLNGDGVKEYLLQAGARASGSAGWTFELYQKIGGEWSSIAEAWEEEEEGMEGWITDRPRWQILPVRHNGYSDLRVAVALCLKWHAGKYVPYEDEDYRALSPDWFDGGNAFEAEIFWMIEHACLMSGHCERQKVEPRWFDVRALLHPEGRPRERFQDFPRGMNTEFNDEKHGLRWVGVTRAGVWGVRGDKGFLVVPRTSYLGVCTFVFVGGWLNGSESCDEDIAREHPDFKYNPDKGYLELSMTDDEQEP